jgi:hypothetical protein
MASQFKAYWPAAASLLLVVSLLHAPRGVAAEPPAGDDDAKSRTERIYTVAEYDPQRDPAKDLVKTIKHASRQHKRIILEIGGEW